MRCCWPPCCWLGALQARWRRLTLPERTTLVDAANGNFEADMLDMLSQYTYRDILELEVHAGEETGFSAAVVDALARLRTVALNISYKAGNEDKTLRLMPGDALLLRELDGSLVV